MLFTRFHGGDYLQGLSTPTKFPGGPVVLDFGPFGDGTFAAVDLAIAEGRCRAGRFDIETSESRLSCFILDGGLYLAGMVEADRFSRVALRDLPVLARQYDNAVAGLVALDPELVRAHAVHLFRRPLLESSTLYVDFEQILARVRRDGVDAAFSLDHDRCRAVLHLGKDGASRLYACDACHDAAAVNAVDLFRGLGWGPDAKEGRLEVFAPLEAERDEDRGKTLAQLADISKPPPPIVVQLTAGDEHVIEQKPFYPPSMLIGRSHNAHLIIDNLAVSRIHAAILWESGRFFVQDLGSINGTSLNGKPITRAECAVGDVIGIGMFRIAIAHHSKGEDAGRKLDPHSTVYLAAKEGRQPAYLVGEGVSVKIDREITIGKGEGVDVHVGGLFTKSIHARVALEDGGKFRLTCDGNSTVKVNGRKLSAAQVGFGDSIEVGDVKVWVVANPGLKRDEG